MLQTLRDKTSGWIATLILGLLIIPFAFFGMESYMSQQVETHAARIAQPPSWWQSAPRVWPLTYLWTTREIDSAAYRQRLEALRMQAREQQGDAFDPQAFESVENKRKIIDAMIDEEVMRMTSERSGIVIGDAQLREAIQAIPDFQVDGVFNLDRYQLLLASQNPPQTPVTFQARMRESLQMGLIPQRLVNSGLVTDVEIDRLMRLLGEQRDVSFVMMPPAPVDDAPVMPAEIEAWYKANANAYRSPESVRVEYVEVNAATLPMPVLDEAALRKRYEEQRSKYASAEQREVAHIQVQVAADASEAQKKAAEAKAKELAAKARAPGADFAALAAANSDDAGSKDKGGDLGWLAKGSMPGAFDDAAFALKAGEVSGPVKSDFGWHIIKVKQVRGGTQRPFEEVRAALEQEMQAAERERIFNDMTGKLVDAVYKNPNSLQPAAQALGLQVQTTPAFSRAGGPGIASDRKVVRAAFSDDLLKQGGASDPIELGPERTVLIRVLEHQPERALPLATVRESVIASIRAERQHKAALAAADALVQAAGSKGLAAAAGEAGLALADLNEVRRGSPVPSPQAVEAFFAVPRPQQDKASVKKARLGDQYMVFAVRAARDGDLAQVTPQERDSLRQQLATAHGIEAQQAFVRAARAKYKIEVAEDRL
ncbi:MAG: peptidyl-prolyl cis-trans isomerase [Thermomonas sp.]|uniref:peptidyl-prolyl cis-trans isomerase n=1 Tax=Thermomonas sp. TaxID=1971895 RepID=UPI0039E52371